MKDLFQYRSQLLSGLLVGVIFWAFVALALAL
jgi:hypothetical protein